MFELFTDRARQAVVVAQVEARSLRHDYIGTEHLLLGVLSETEGVAARTLGALGVDREQIRRGILDVVGMGPVIEPDSTALHTLGIDLDEVRRRAEDAFGPGALDRTRTARAGSRR